MALPKSLKTLPISNTALPKSHKPRYRQIFFRLAFSLLFMVTGILGVTSCGKPASTPGYSPDSTRALNFLAHLYQWGEDLKTFAIQGEATYLRGGVRRFYRFTLVASKPQTFLFTAIDPLGRPAFKLLATDLEYRALDYLNAIYYVGGKGSLDLDNFFPIPFGNREFLAIFSGALFDRPFSAKTLEPFPDNPGQVRLSYTGEMGGETTPYLLEVNNEGTDWGNLENITILSLLTGLPFRPDLELKYGSFAPQPREDLGVTVPFPGSITLKWKEANRDREIYVKNQTIRLGFPIPSEILTLEKPEGFTFEAL
ncbi:MAG: hypothetical protein LBF22_05960 [Deltaproteobacteria bacterium]|jgi:hypothetical protein|nr:hypothetical protein [Deltaproteobacteria bacterium]